MSTSLADKYLKLCFSKAKVAHAHPNKALTVIIFKKHKVITEGCLVGVVDLAEGHVMWRGALDMQTCKIFFKSACPFWRYKQF